MLPFYRFNFIFAQTLNFIAKDKLHTDVIIHHFKNKRVFETQDIFTFYNQIEKDIRPTTVNWRVHTLVQSGVLQRIGKGKFTLGEGKMYVPEISTIIRSIFKKLKKEFPFAKFCVWDTLMINEFMQHQPNRNMILVETDKEITNSAFYFLREIKKSVFVEPTADILEKYVVNEKEIVVVKPMVSEAPIQHVNDVETATIEKMLVDIFSDDIIFSAQQGVEMRTIFKNAFDKYTINQSKMLRYADRRRKKDEISKFVKTISNLWQY